VDPVEPIERTALSAFWLDAANTFLDIMVARHKAVARLQ
jgi:hypothetical protein